VARVKFGDIIEVPTQKGYAYAQYTHKDKMMGALLRVFKGFRSTRPKDFTEVVEQPIQFSTFFPLQRAVNMDIVHIVDNISTSKELQTFPTFRVGGLIDPKTKKIKRWSLWDGEKEMNIDKLSTEHKKLPILETLNDTMLISRIEDEWTPEKDITTT